MQPHPNVDGDEYFDRQNDVCKGCKWNEWGSAQVIKDEYDVGRGGRGKACQNRMRLMLIPAGIYVPKPGVRGSFDLEMFEDPAEYESSEMLALKLPVTSVKEYGNYLKSVQRDYQRPPYGVITNIYIEHGGSNQYTVKFETVDAFPDEWFPLIQKRHEEARDAIINPYTAPSEDDKPQRAAEPQGNNRLAGLRK